jgi:hypothetical protein
MGDVLSVEQKRRNAPPATQTREPRGEPDSVDPNLAAGESALDLVEPSRFFEKAFLVYGVAYLELVRQVREPSRASRADSPFALGW